MGHYQALNFMLETLVKSANFHKRFQHKIQCPVTMYVRNLEAIDAEESKEPFTNDVS